MFTKLRMLVLAILIASPAFAGSAHAGIQDFTIRNYSGDYIHYIYVSPVYSDSWEEDILGRDVLPPRTEIFVEMSGYSRHDCYFDILIVDEFGYEAVYNSVDLCRVAYVDFE